MLPSTVQSNVRAQPFRPFRIVMNSGKTYDVRHPEFLHVGRDVCIYYHAAAPGEPFDSWESISLLLMQSVERADHLATPKA